MIHLIMVFSAIMPSFRSTGELSSHSPITKPSPTFPFSMQMADEIRGRVFSDELQMQSYLTAKKRNTTGTKIRDLDSHKPHEKMPYMPGRILQKDTEILRIVMATQNKRDALETTTSLPLKLSNRQIPVKWKFIEQPALTKKEMISSAYATVSEIPENIYNSDLPANGILTKVERLTVDRKTLFAANEDENMSTNRRCRVKRSIRNIHNHEKRHNRTITGYGRSSGFINRTDLFYVTTEKNGTPSEGDPPEIGTVANMVNNTASDTGNTTSSRGQRRRRGRRRQHRQSKDLALWIDERQVKLFSGYIMEIFAIHDGHVLPYILDPNFEKHLPVIPFEVQSVNFTWQAGRKRYYYTFDRLFSHDRNILQDPLISLQTQGRIPRKPKVFTVFINCTGNASGIAVFEIGLLIQTRRGKPLPGTPLRLKLRKECTQPSPDPACDEKCENGGVCDAGRKCQCPEGYMGQYCNTALCYPQCMNGGTCTTPGRCTCPPGYQGRHCEGGICRDKCENGGKCIQKDTCACPRGYYGNRCEFSKCVIPCINGGRCRNVNKCRCPLGFAGDHCEIVTGRSLGTTAVARCSKKCRHGSCNGTNCQCQLGFTGRWCRRRGGNRKPVWL